MGRGASETSYHGPSLEGMRPEAGAPGGDGREVEAGGGDRGGTRRMRRGTPVRRQMRMRTVMTRSRSA